VKAKIKFVVFLQILVPANSFVAIFEILGKLSKLKLLKKIFGILKKYIDINL
jgi:hypothetical protein